MSAARVGLGLRVVAKRAGFPPGGEMVLELGVVVAQP